MEWGNTRRKWSKRIRGIEKLLERGWGKHQWGEGGREG